MMVNCPVCGKLTCIHWPEHWVYRRGETYYCRAMCMDVDIVRDMNLLKQVRADRKKRKEAKKMEKMKKDGTPAKKPGPKKKDGIAQVKVDGALRIETPEADMIEIVETPENTKRVIKRRGDFEISAIRDAELGEFYYDIKYNSIDWRTEAGDEVSLSPTGWKNLAEELPDILAALGAKV